MLCISYFFSEKHLVKNEKATLSVTSLLSTTTSLPPTTASMTSSSPSSSSSTIKSTGSQIESSQHLHDSNFTVDMCLSPLYHFDLKRNEKLTLYSPGFQSGNRYPVNLHCSVSIATTPKRVRLYLLVRTCKRKAIYFSSASVIWPIRCKTLSNPSINLLAVLFKKYLYTVRSLRILNSNPNGKQTYKLEYL